MARQRGNRWQADVKDNEGKRVRVSFSSREEAEAWEEEARVHVRRGLPLPPASRNGKTEAVSARGLTLSALADEAYDEIWRHNRDGENSYSNARDVVATIGESKAVGSITYADIADLRSKLLDRGLTRSTVNRKLAALSRMLTHAHTTGHLKSVPKIPRFKEASGRIRWVSEKEEQQMLAWAARKQQPDIRDLWIVLLDTGMRVGEALALEWDNVDFAANRLRIWENKADHPRSIPMTRRVAEVLQKRKRGFAGTTSQVYPGIPQRRVNRVWDSMKADLGLADDSQFVPHCLRHTFCTRLIQRGVGLPKVQKLAGHKTIQMTLRYSHLGDEDLAEAVTALEK